MAFMMLITAKEYQSLQDEKNQIEAELAELQEKLDDMEARELGDSTSDAFFQIKREQGNLEQRLDYIKEEINNADVVVDVDTTEVNVGTRVTLYSLDEDTEQTYDVVSTIEADTEATRLTSDSPLGEAIMGHEVNDEINVETRVGMMNYRITDIQATPTQS